MRNAECIKTTSKFVRNYTENSVKSDLKHWKLFAIFMELNNNNKYYENFNDVKLNEN